MTTLQSFPMTPDDQDSQANLVATRHTRSLRIFFIGVFLLILSGATATTVGFKVKSADIERKTVLRETFHALVGDPSAVQNKKQALYSPSASNEQKLFVSVYQLNEWVRSTGLLTALQNLDPEIVVQSVNGLKEIAAPEPFRVVEETWSLLHGETAVGALVTTAPSTPYDPKAARIAKRYDRSFMREVDARLFYYIKLKNLESQKP